jgi:hypothetical protein
LVLILSEEVVVDTSQRLAAASIANIETAPQLEMREQLSQRDLLPSGIVGQTIEKIYK